MTPPQLSRYTPVSNALHPVVPNFDMHIRNNFKFSFFDSFHGFDGTIIAFYIPKKTIIKTLKTENYFTRDLRWIILIKTSPLWLEHWFNDVFAPSTNWYNHRIVFCFNEQAFLFQSINYLFSSIESFHALENKVGWRFIDSSWNAERGNIIDHPSYKVTTKFFCIGCKHKC